MIKLLLDLLPYQEKAVDKLLKYKIGACYMEMGTGKTLIALTLIKNRYDRKKINHCIWLCPFSITEETKKNIKSTAIMPENFLTICGIESLSSSQKTFSKIIKIMKSKECYLIIDESLLVKNPYALRTINITRLSTLAEYKMILNGTPISKNAADLFSQWFLLDWRVLGYQSYWSFAANHLEFDEKFQYKIRRVLNVDYLIDKISPFTYEIKKEDVLKDLPKKIYLGYTFDLTYEQEEHYEYVKDMFLSEELLYKTEYDDNIIFRLFNALQQVTSGRKIISKATEPIRYEPFYNGEDNPRIQALINIIMQIPEDDKIIIWCKYTHEIYEIYDVLKARGYNSVIYNGEMSKKKRDISLENFRTSAKFILINKGCGAFGLNLQFCHYMIFYSNDFNYATRAQAEDRVHRLGQSHDVVIYDLYASCKIDQRIQMNLEDKESLLYQFCLQLKNKKDIKHWLDGLDDK